MPVNVLPAAAAVARAGQTDRTFYAPLRPVLIGPRAGLHRYAVTAERALLGAYDPVADAAYAYPDRVAGSPVDLASVKLYAAVADLNYFNKYTGVNGSCQPSTTYPNRVRAASYVFKTANGATRSADFGDRDVKAGDVAVVRLDATTLTTTVAGFAGEPVAAVTGAATGDANNAASQAAASSISQVAGTPVNDVVATVDHSGYESTADGYITRTYTITVTLGSTGGDATTARLRVRSADGLDDADDVVPAAFGSPTAVGGDGLQITWDIDTAHSSASLFGIDEDDFVVGQQWTVTVSEAFTAPTATAAGTYTGPRDDTIIATVTRGGPFAGATKPQITITTARGSDTADPVDVTAAATPVAAGSYGVTLAFDQTALRKGDVYYVEVTAATEGAVRTLVLRDDVPAALLGQEVDLRLYARRTDILIPKNRTLPAAAANWAATADGVTVEGGIYLTDSEFTTAGDPVGVPLGAADLVLEYREWLTAGAAELVSLADPADIEAALGPVDPTNPLAQAAALALANTAGELEDNPARPAAATTDPVLCVALGGDPADAALWTTALEAIEDDDRVYAVVPLSTDPAVRTAVAAHVAAQSTDAAGFYRVCWLAASVAETGVVAAGTDGAPITATIAADPDSSPTAYTLVTASAGAGFVTAGARAGDTLRINYGVDADGVETYDAYPIAEVRSEQTLLLTEGPAAAIAVARRVEVWRVYTAAELVARLVADAAAFASDRVRYVWPDRVSFGGVEYDGHTLCAALAGLSGSVPSHQGLRNLGPAGVDSLAPATRTFSSGQLSDLAAGGVFVVGRTPAGTVYVRAARTTDMSSTGTREETIVRNADMLRKAVQAAWAPYVGSGNVVSNLRQLLEGALAQLTNRLRAANRTAELGPPVANLALTSVGGVAGSPDVVEVTVTATGLPVPLNQIRVRLPVSV